MALACRCDRCGNFFIPNQYGMVKGLKTADVMIGDRIESSINIKGYHLCDKCFSNFEIWFHEYDDLKENLKDENKKKMD